MTEIRRIGFAYNPTKEDAVELSARATGWCAVRGIEGWAIASADHDGLVRALPGTQVLVVLGGDGTFLRAARAVTEVDVPLVGVNLGKVGFLSKAEANELEPLLEKIISGAYRLESRMALRGAIHGPGGGAPRRTFVALNDVVVARGSLARVVRLEVDIGPSHLATYIADGLVVASPTGSTGYSFSAGGPILDPLSRNLVVSPIAAYLSAIRSVVVSPDQLVRCRVVEAHEALVSIDGREDVRLSVGDVVTVAALERPIRFLEPDGALPFWDLLRQPDIIFHGLVGNGDDGIAGILKLRIHCFCRLQRISITYIIRLIKGKGKPDNTDVHPSAISIPQPHDIFFRKRSYGGTLVFFKRYDLAILFVKGIRRYPIKLRFIDTLLQFALRDIKFMIAKNGQVGACNGHYFHHLLSAYALAQVLNAVVNRGAYKISGHH